MITLLLALGLVVAPPVLQVQDVHVVEVVQAAETIDWTPALLETLARTTAQKYGVNEYALVETLRCESMGFTWNDQSLVPDAKGPRGREDSWGIGQFNMPSDLKTADGREITKEIALDQPEAIDAAGYNFSIGKASRWSCYNALSRP